MAREIRFVPGETRSGYGTEIYRENGWFKIGRLKLIISFVVGFTVLKVILNWITQHESFAMSLLLGIIGGLVSAIVPYVIVWHKTATEIEFRGQDGIRIKTLSDEWIGSVNKYQGVERKRLFLNTYAFIIDGREVVLSPTMERREELIERFRSMNPSMKVGGY